MPRRKPTSKTGLPCPEDASSALNPASSAAPARPLCVLVVDRDSGSQAVLRQFAKARAMKLVRVRSAAEARLKLAELPVDLTLVDPHLPDASGLDFISEIRRGRSQTPTILLGGFDSVDDTIAAVRAGVADVVRKPLVTEELATRVDAALRRQREDRLRRQQVTRLRRVCRKLSQARDEITQQVDILCHDLVQAYQELASQVQGVVQVNDFTAMVKHELDLEKILRHTLEYLLQKAGPTNAAVFLPAAGDEYALGGYVNYDCTRESADLLLQHMADVLAPRIGQLIQPLRITDNRTLHEWLGADAAYLADSHVISFPCRHEDEPLAVITLFRDGGQPFEDSLLEICNAIGPLLGGYLAKVIRVHHRHLPDVPA